ncbi:MAG: DUF3791 domain-containing protein [Paludibacteraceae bacterium]|nr:DUF3791 domain-containing protein [Paludibacteraceae bacterium]
MSREDHNIVGYVVALVSEFATRNRIRPQQAYGYLKRFKGLDYLYQHYNVVHTFSFEDSVEAITEVCKHNGGKLS